MVATTKRLGKLFLKGSLDTRQNKIKKKKKLGFVRLCKRKRVHWPRERRCLNKTRQNKRLWRSRDYEVADERSRKTGTDPACLDPREWLPVLSLGGPWGAEGCCQLGWTAQDLPPHAIHNHLHPQPRSPPLARHISGAIQLSPSTSLFASKQLDAHYRKNHPLPPLRISLTVTMTTATRKTTRYQGPARKPDITTSMNIWVGFASKVFFPRIYRD